MIDFSILDNDQQQAVVAPRGPVAILAGAGTGKTRTITYRIAHLIDQGFVSPQRILAVTFSRRAAQEMLNRLQAMGIGQVAARTFHSAALRQLGYFWPRYAGALQWQVLDRSYLLIHSLTKQQWGKDTVRDIAAEIEWAKSMLITPEEYPNKLDGRVPPIPAAQLAEIFEAYEKQKYAGSQVLLDYSDMLMHMTAALESNAGIAAEFRQQYRSFVVDEYQDVTPLQQRLLDAWLGERDDLTVVGDANQTIYSFNGATPEYLLDFSTKYRHATVVRLQRDYRSTPEVTDLANRVISQATGRAAGSRLELEGLRPSIQVYPEFHSYPDEDTEAQAVADQIQQLLAQGHSAGEIAILFRTNYQSERFEEALTQRNIAYQMHGQQRFFERPAIIEALALIRRAANRPHPTMPVSQLVRTLLEKIGHEPEKPTGRQKLQRWHSLETLLRICEDLETQHPHLSLAQLLQLLELRGKQQRDPKTAEVSLASMHAAKGLEWNTVFLVGLVEGNIPISHALKAGTAAIEEERRLLYVGITRARERLYLSWSTGETKSGGKQQVTRFLASFGGVISHGASQAAMGLPLTCKICHRPLETAQARVEGRCPECPAVLDEQAIAALQAWRNQEAQSCQLPSNMILSDAMIRAIVEANPQRPDQLRGIPGMGDMRIAQYGPAIVQVLRPFRDEL